MDEVANVVETLPDGSLLLFVYGTLKHGFCRNSVLREFKSRYLGTAKTGPEYTLYDAVTYPAMVVPEQGGTGVEGELYAVPPEYAKEALRRLDYIEGAPFLYQRHSVDLVEAADFKGQPIDVSRAVTYLYQRPFARMERIGPRWSRK